MTISTQRIVISLDRGSFSALTHGDESSPIILCIHGFPDHARSFDGIAPALVEAGYRVVAPWLRGYAPSTLDGPFDMETIADDIVAIANHLSPHRPVVLIGHDWGAVASYVALARAPERFSHAITMAVPHPRALLRNLRRYPRQLRLSWYMAFFQLRGLADFVVQRDKLAFIDRLWRDWSPGYVLPLESMRDLKRCLAASLPAPLAYYRAMFSPTPRALAQRKRVLRAISAIDVPTLYLHGAQDGCMLYAVGEGQERFFTRGFWSECVPNTGHFLHMEAPAPIAQTILAFLRS